MILTPKFPLSFDDTYGFANSDTIREVVHFHLKNLILTNPGEKISDPSYGVGVRQYLFEPGTSGLVNAISDEILSAIKIHLTYLRDVSVAVESLFEENKINIKITYTIPNLTQDSFTLDVESGTNY